MTDPLDQTIDRAALGPAANCLPPSGGFPRRPVLPPDIFKPWPTLEESFKDLIRDDYVRAANARIAELEQSTTKVQEHANAALEEAREMRAVLVAFKAWFDEQDLRQVDSKFDEAMKLFNAAAQKGYIR